MSFSNTSWHTKKQLFAKKPWCGICLHPLRLDGSDVTIDHVIPKSKGGTDNLSNLQLAHRYCNYEKADKILSTVKTVSKS